MKYNRVPASISRILIVDDDADILFLSKVFFERSGHFIVNTAQSAIDGFNLLKKDQYDLIISDYDMPFVNGIAFLNLIRKEGLCTPFILFSSKDICEIGTFHQNYYAYIQKKADPKSLFSELIDLSIQMIEQFSPQLYSPDIITENV
jgi:DNA-binding NtrC family response regulator